jgi:hypothetical protein
MKTLLLLGAMLVILDAAIVPMSAQTASASPAATVSPRPTPGGASPSPRPTLAASPLATGSPTTSGAATLSPSTTPERGARVRPAVTSSPSGGAQLEGESPPTQQSPLQVATPAERTKATPSRPHRKQERREGSTPPESSGEQK